ncbi:MAG: IPT/TIG domain-containing protein, partial [Planctomycetota bacterium]|nr:IPT/TIG domain-containing protein [Planctomycetota bacterium]
MTVHGDGFASASESLGVLTCRIGGAVRRAVWARSSAIVCNSTRTAAGEARVEMSNNAREYTSSGIRLRLVSLRVLDVQPWSGPVGGATVVSVVAHGSWPGGLSCRFGEASASTGWSGGASRLRCLTPPSSGLVSGWVGVQLSSFNGALSSGGSFYYHAALSASGAAPALGPEAGGTRVVLLGGGFRDAYTLRCAFGSSAAPVLARYVDESQLECSSPVHAVGSASVLLSMNGQQYAASGVSYTYQASATVSYVSPSSVLSEGGTPVTVHGDGFASASESLGVLTCRIGGAVRRAVWASSSALVCNATRAAAGEARLEVSNNAREYTSSGVRVRL